MSQVISARVDDDTFALVDQIARANGRSRGWFAARAIRQAAEEETAFLASLDEADRRIEAGEFYTQDEIEAWLEAKIEARSAKTTA